MEPQAKILVVEDDPVSRDLLAAILEAERHDVAVAADGFEALQLIRESAFDCIVVDYHLPEMDGYAFARLIRELTEDLVRPPLLVAITGDRDGLALRRGSDGVFQAILAKPVPPGELLRLVRETLARSRRDPVLAAAQRLVADPVAASAVAASRAFWRAAGLPDRPSALVWPSPNPDQSQALALCFDLVEAGTKADLAVLTSLNDLDRLVPEHGSEVALLPLVSVDRLDPAVVDGEFSLHDRACWSHLSRLIRDMQGRRDALPAAVRGSEAAVDRIAAFLHVRGRPWSPETAGWAALGLAERPVAIEGLGRAVSGRLAAIERGLPAALPARECDIRAGQEARGDRAMSAQQMSIVTGPTGRAGRRALVIEPVELMADILAAVLRGAGYAVTLARSLEDSPAAPLDLLGFDVVVTSVELWRARSAAIARRDPSRTALVLTAPPGHGSEDAGSAEALAAVVARPARPRELLAAAEGLLARRDALSAHDSEMFHELVATIGQPAADRLMAKLREEVAVFLARCPGWPAETLRGEAHKLKGAAGMLGFARLAEACADVECGPKGGAAAPDAARRLAEACRQALTFMGAPTRRMGDVA